MIPKELFTRIAVPDRLANVPLAKDSDWHTWSPESRCVLAALSQKVTHLSPPQLIHLQNGRGYDYTYSLAESDLWDSSLGRDIACMASRIVEVSAPQSIFFFSGLVDEEVCGKTVHYLFAIMRDAIAKQADSPWAALYAPLANVGQNAGDFPLHCDMYSPEMLWNIFEDVPHDGSGAALFLETSKMLEIMEQIDLVPASVVDGVRECLIKTSDRDRFEWLYDKLHGSDHIWTSELRLRMSKQQARIEMAKGDGYLIHDRRWLHGREAPQKGVSAKRVHRLVFDLKSSFSRRKSNGV